MAATISSHIGAERDGLVDPLVDPDASNEQARSAAASLCAAARVLARNATGPDRERHRCCSPRSRTQPSVFVWPWVDPPNKPRNGAERVAGTPRPRDRDRRPGRGGIEADLCR